MQPLPATLRELFDAVVKACGPAPFVHIGSDAEGGIAHCHGRDGHRITRRGATTTEAVSRLWVALTEDDMSLDDLARACGITLEPCKNRPGSYYLMQGSTALPNPKTGLPFFTASEAQEHLERLRQG